MPNGMIGVRAIARELEARKDRVGDGTPMFRFRVDDGESAVVRFLEQGEHVEWAWCHDVYTVNRWETALPCRNQDENGIPIGERCPGCERGLPKKFKGWINLIWRDAPVFARYAHDSIQRDEAGKPIIEYTEDHLAVWNSGIKLFQNLHEKDLTYGGLTSRDFRIARHGTGIDTTYAIDPAHPNVATVPLSDNDKRLALEKVDLTRKVTPQSYETWGIHNSRMTESTRVTGRAT